MQGLIQDIGYSRVQYSGTTFVSFSFICISLKDRNREQALGRDHLDLFSALDKLRIGPRYHASVRPTSAARVTRLPVFVFGP